MLIDLSQQKRNFQSRFLHSTWMSFQSYSTAHILFEAHPPSISPSLHVLRWGILFPHLLTSSSTCARSLCWVSGGPVYCSSRNTSTPTSLLHAFLRILECTSPPWEAARVLKLSMATGLEERHSNMRCCFSCCHGRSAKIDQNMIIEHSIGMFSRTSAQS